MQVDLLANLQEKSTRRTFMIDPIPSKWMKNYLKMKNRELTDRETATLIWNVPNVYWSERLATLQALERTTSDQLLKTQIQERVSFEIEEFENFKENSQGTFIYVVEDADREAYGYFSAYEAAYRHLLSCIETYKEYHPEYFEIKKHVVYDEVKLEEAGEDCGFEDASATFDLQGGMTFFYTCAKCNYAETEQERFEKAFFRIPCGMNYCSVKLLQDDTYGVVCNTEEKWQAYLEECSNSDTDYDDLQVIVYCLTENGFWAHEHVNPLYLEPEMPPLAEGDRKSAARIEATEALVRYLQEETAENAEEVIRTAQKYAEECNRERTAVRSIQDVFC